MGVPRASRAVGEVQKNKSEIFWREDFLEGRSAESMCVCPAHPCARTFARREAPLDGSFKEKGLKVFKFFEILLE